MLLVQTALKTTVGETTNWNHFSKIILHFYLKYTIENRFMIYRKIYSRVATVLYALLLLILSVVTDGCFGPNERKIDTPALTVEAESYISNSGNIDIVNEKKNVVSVQTKDDDSWLCYKINVPATGRYSIRLYAKNASEKKAVCWIEDYIDNKDGRIYNVSGNMIVGGEDSDYQYFVLKEGALLAASLHYIKLHIEKGALNIDKLTFTLIRENKSSPLVSSKADINDWQLVWSDEFNGHGLPDSTKWIYDTKGNSASWGNNEAQCYTVGRKENAMVENGNLEITAIKEVLEGKKYTSARLITKAAWQYGRIEVRAKLPNGRGTWPAIWMMPGGWSFKDGNWPDVGEIDILEHVGHDLNVIHASAHSKDYQWQKGNQKTAIITVPGATENFHNYILEWSSEIMKISVDDSCYFTYKNEGLGETKWPYNKPFYLILNVAIGGAWGNAKGIDDAAFPQTMDVDYVRIYQKK